MSNALELLKAFLTAFYEQRDAERALALLSEDVLFFGISGRCDAKGREDAASILREEVRRLPVPRALRYLEEESIPTGNGCGACFINARILTESMEHACRISALSSMEDGAAKLAFLHMSTADARVEKQLSDLIHTVPSGICLHRWDGDDLHPIIVNSQFTEMLGEDAFTYMCGVDHMNYTHVHPDDLAGLKKASYEALTKTHHIDYTYRSRNFKTNEYLWVRMRGALVPQPDGTQLVYVSYSDVTQEHVTEEKLRAREKELLAKYELEKSRPSLGGHLLARALIDLTSGETREYEYKNGAPVPETDRTAFAWGRNTVHLLLPDDEDRARFRALNDPEAMIAAFARGETEFRLDYRRRVPDGGIRWVRNVLHLLRDPARDHILAFEYYYDIDEEKLQELMYFSLATSSCDYVSRVNLTTGQYVILPQKHLSYTIPSLSGEDSDALVRSTIPQSIAPEDREIALANLLCAGIRENLKSDGRFRFTCREMQPDGSVRFKNFTEYYLDRERDIAVVTREDVTPLIQAESEKNELLAAALSAANAASRAKSQFLSRMSHELRTPMNAIIGLSSLAASEVGNPAMMADTIQKIDQSARYLLSLINDILEMSRIESGRLTLSEGAFSFETLIATVNTVIYAQAQAKGVDYESTVTGFTEPSYIGDSTKLQQVLINVLGNAVKFTAAGGKITFAIEQVRAVNDRATLRFTVTDTGSGISEEFLPHLFDAFSQEADTFSSAGTGLGLAIAKSTVEMMGGQIHVKSIKGVGSVFTIEVPFTVSAESGHMESRIRSLPIASLRSLVADDDATVCKSMLDILLSFGIRAEAAASGSEAIRRTEAAKDTPEPFNLFFIDWQMPELDGVETARRIRSLAGKDAAIVIITAYDRAAIETTAIDAGANLFLEKPLFRPSVLNALERIYAVRTQQSANSRATTYDFTGKRFLLAEDQPLNVEVAKRLLERTGAEVTVTGNGLEALEAFATAENHYFDAILMDIRMPVMDGLTAAKNIRSLKKADSKRIPIIAMTANAFDEDVERSLAHGMDAHLIKPIEPDNLYSVLKRLLDTRNAPAPK